MQFLSLSNNGKVTGINSDAVGYFQVTVQVPPGHTVVGYSYSLFNPGTYNPVLFSDSATGLPVTTDSWTGVRSFALNGFTTPSSVVDMLWSIVLVDSSESSVSYETYGGTYTHS